MDIFIFGYNLFTNLSEYNCEQFRQILLKQDATTDDNKTGMEDGAVILF